MQRSIIVIILAVFIQLGANDLNGQDSILIFGRVTDAEGALVRNAVLVLKVERSDGSARVITGENGRFRFEDVTTGDYSLVISAEGFETVVRKVRVGKSAALKIVLSPRNIAEVVSVTSNYLAGTVAVLERTPGAFQALSKEELEGSRVFNFSEALRKVSGVNIRDEEGFGLRPNISIRGSDPTRSRKVLLLEDGMPLSYAPYGDNSSYYHPPIERFESVEVLKGSGQIEYGPVTVAGVVNYITPNPTDRKEFKLKLSGGNRDYLNGSASFSGSFGSTGVFIGYARKQGEGSRDNIRSGVNDLNVKVVQPINARNIVVLKYSHFNEDSRITYSGLTEEEFIADPRQNPFRNDDLDFFREGFSAVHTSAFTNNFSVNTSFYTSYFSRDWWRQSSNSGQRPNRLGSDPDCLGMQDLNTTCGNQGTPRDFRVIGVEPRFNYRLETGRLRNDMSFGFRVHYETQNRRAFLGEFPDSRGGEITEHNFRSSYAASSYFQDRLILGNFSITPGVRIERVSYERRNLLNGARAETDLTQVIPGIGIAYNPFSNTTVFAGIHRGFAPPSTSDILTNNGGVVNLDSELSWNFETGLRIRPGNAVTLEATFFRNDFQNQIVAASVAGGTGSAQTNGGETLQQGIEINARADSRTFFASGVNFYVQTAYTLLGTARFTGKRFSSVSGYDSVTIGGNRLPYAPRHLVTTSFGLDYKSLSGFIENVHISDQFSDDLNTRVPIPNGQRGLIPNQTYFNATMNYTVEKWRSTFFVSTKNLFDRLFIVDRTRGIYPSSPRLIQFGWKWQFSK